MDDFLLRLHAGRVLERMDIGESKGLSKQVTMMWLRSRLLNMLSLLSGDIISSRNLLGLYKYGSLIRCLRDLGSQGVTVMFVVGAAN